ERLRSLAPEVPNRLALNDVVDVEVFDDGWSVSEPRLFAERPHLLAPCLSLLARLPHLEDSNLSVVADRGDVKDAPGRWGVADSQLLAHLVVLVGRDPR